MIAAAGSGNNNFHHIGMFKAGKRSAGGKIMTGAINRSPQLFFRIPTEADQRMARSTSFRGQNARSAASCSLLNAM